MALLSDGVATEANPIMAVLVAGDVRWFAALKVAITGLSVMLMVFLARYRFLKVVRVEVVLYCVLGGYVVLIGYELQMLQEALEFRLF